MEFPLASPGTLPPQGRCGALEVNSIKKIDRFVRVTSLYYRTETENVEL